MIFPLHNMSSWITGRPVRRVFRGGGAPPHPSGDTSFPPHPSGDTSFPPHPSGDTSFPHTPLHGRESDMIQLSQEAPGGLEETPVEISFEQVELVETPAETPVETPVETPAETPVETPAETPAETPVETPVETPAEMPMEPVETLIAPVEKPFEPVENPVETSIVHVETPLAPVENTIETSIMHVETLVENNIETPLVPVELVETPLELVETPVETALELVETPVETALELVETPVTKPIDTPLELVETLVDTPRELVEKPIETPLESAEEPVDAPPLEDIIEPLVTTEIFSHEEQKEALEPSLTSPLLLVPRSFPPEPHVSSPCPHLFTQELAYKESYDATMTRLTVFHESHCTDESPALITFILPTIQRPSLQRALTSLFQQTCQNWKAIILFDGCQPMVKTLPILKDRRIMFASIEKTGVVTSTHSKAGYVRNVGLHWVRTPWVGFLDDDDRLTADYVERLTEECHITPTADLIIFKMNDKTLILPPPSSTQLVKNEIGISFAYRSSLIQEGFRFGCSEHEDYQLVHEIYRAGKKVVFSPYVTYVVRNSLYQTPDTMDRVCLL